jgi:hypothetical protein
MYTLYVGDFNSAPQEQPLDTAPIDLWLIAWFLVLYRYKYPTGFENKFVCLSVNICVEN